MKLLLTVRTSHQDTWSWTLSVSVHCLSIPAGNQHHYTLLPADAHPVCTQAIGKVVCEVLKLAVAACHQIDVTEKIGNEYLMHFKYQKEKSYLPIIVPTSVFIKLKFVWVALVLSVILDKQQLLWSHHPLDRGQDVSLSLVLCARAWSPTYWAVSRQSLASMIPALHLSLE